MVSNFKFIKYFYFPAYCLFYISLIFLVAKPVKATEDICQLITNSENIEALIELERSTDIEQSLNDINCDGKSLMEIAIDNSPYRWSKNTEFDIRPGRYDNVIWLIDNGFDINRAITYREDTAIHLAAQRRDVNLIHLLLDRGANINIQNKYLETPLFAEVMSNSSTVNLLLHLGADPTIKNHADRTPLQEAVYWNAVDSVELLLQHGVIPNYSLLEYKIQIAERENSDDVRRTLPSIEVIKNYQELRAKAISQGADPQQLTFNPPPPPNKQLLPSRQDPLIVTATRQNDFATIKKLIAAGENIDAVSKSGKENSDYAARSLTDRYSATALHIALSLQYTEIAKLLIEFGANITLENAAGNHPLYLAAYDYKLTKMLLDKGALVDRRSGKSKRTALMSDFMTVEVAKLLLQTGADINQWDNYGYTPLQAAIENKNISLTKFLVKSGANLNLEKYSNLNGYWYKKAPLYQAAITNQPEIVILLLKNGAKKGINFAYEAAILEQHRDIELLFKQFGVDYPDKKQLLNKAAEQGKINLVEKLLDEGLEDYIKTEAGSQILFGEYKHITHTKEYEVKYEAKDYEIVELLLKRGADVNATHKNKRTPLHYASRSGDLDRVTLLLKYGADTTIEDSKGKNALFTAIFGLKPYDLSQAPPMETKNKLAQRLDVVKLLLKKDPPMTNSEYLKFQQSINQIKNYRIGQYEEIVKYGDRIDSLVEKHRKSYQ